MTGTEEEDEEEDVEIHNDDGDDNDSTDELIGPIESASDEEMDHTSDAVRIFLRKSKPHRSAPPPTTCEKSKVSFISHKKQLCW